MNASRNQKAALIDLADYLKFPTVKQELLKREVYLDEVIMTKDRVIKIRSAMFANKPQLALQLIEKYPIKGGESQ